jgi:hypothetical protein
MLTSVVKNGQICDATTDADPVGTPPTIDEVVDVLAKIHTGEVVVVDLEAVRAEWERTYAGNVEIRLSNGWALHVFNDCDSWDYIDTIVGPWGVVHAFEEDKREVKVPDPTRPVRYEGEFGRWWNEVINWEPPDAWGL